MNAPAGRAAPIGARQGKGRLVMTRAGRTRKSGARYPSGQLKPKKKEIDDRVRTSRQPHRRVVAHELRANGADDLDVQKASAGEEAESPIGRLWLGGHLRLQGDADEAAARDRYDAANMFSQIVGAYRSVIESPKDVAGSGRGFPCEPVQCLDKERLPDHRCECEVRLRRYMSAYEALAGRLRRLQVDIEFGEETPEALRAAITEHRRLREDEAYVGPAAQHRRVLMAVNRVAVHRQAIDDQELVYLVHGLEQLRQHFGLTTRRKPKHY
jgi:hypothetical protein